MLRYIHEVILLAEGYVKIYSWSHSFRWGIC